MELDAKQRESLNRLMGMIHPKLNDVGDLVNCLRVIIRAKRSMNIEGKLDEKLALILVDLYAVIKDITDDFDLPSGFMGSIDAIVAQWNIGKGLEG